MQCSVAKRRLAQCNRAQLAFTDVYAILETHCTHLQRLFEPLVRVLHAEDLRAAVQPAAAATVLRPARTAKASEI